jgi:multidrug/hemolysin transport system permease protein
MKVVLTLIKRNIKLFFNDKGMFLTSLITPLILLLLYATFLGNVYRDSFIQNFPKEIIISESVINGLVGGQLTSSILAVSCVTVAFCSNFLMVQDKALGNIKDITISPIKSTKLSLSYYIASLISTLIICFVAAVACLIYVSSIGWYMSFIDVVLLFVDVILLVFFGTALSSVINYFLSSQGQISAVGTVVSSCYGFICGAYMPISSFGDGLQKVISFLPGTYGTSLLREHAMRGAIGELSNQGMPEEHIKAIKDAMDSNVYFFGTSVTEVSKFLILIITILLLLGIYIFMNKFRKINK